MHYGKDFRECLASCEQAGTFPVALQGTKDDKGILQDIHRTGRRSSLYITVLWFAGHVLSEADYDQATNYHETDGMMSMFLL